MTTADKIVHDPACAVALNPGLMSAWMFCKCRPEPARVIEHVELVEISVDSEPNPHSTGHVVSIDGKPVNAPAYCYYCGRTIEWSHENGAWVHTPKRMHEIRPVYDRVNAGNCDICKKPIHRTSEGILRHSNGPHADHGHSALEEQ
jgi:hypothetical protein